MKEFLRNSFKIFIFSKEMVASCNNIFYATWYRFWTIICPILQQQKSKHTQSCKKITLAENAKYAKLSRFMYFTSKL